MGVSKASRPRKRLGGGGYGYLNNMNNSKGGREVQKTKIYRQVGNKNKNSQKFSK